MEHLAPSSPLEIIADSSETTPVTPIFPNLPDPVLKGDIELARQDLTSTRQGAFSLLERLSRMQQRLSSDLGFHKEENNLVATRKWADNVLNVAWQVITKAGKLVDEVDFLLPRLEKVNEVPSEQVERMQIDEPFADKKDARMETSGSQDAEDEIL